MVILIATITYLAGYYLWRIPNVYADIVIRSGFTTAVYIFLSYIFKVSEDLDDKINRTLKRSGHLK